MVFDYSFNICTCAETKHVQLLNGSGDVSCFVLLVFWFSRLVDQRMNNKNTEVTVINICLQQNGELILNILQQTIQTIYVE